MPKMTILVYRFIKSSCNFSVIIINGMECDYISLGLHNNNKKIVRQNNFCPTSVNNLKLEIKCYQLLR